MLELFYSVLLGVLGAALAETAIYTLYPAPTSEEEYFNTEKATEEAKQQRHEQAKRLAKEREHHCAIHYCLSLAGSMVFASVSLLWSKQLGIIGQGLMLASVLCIATGTAFGISGGGRVAKLAVATVSFGITLALGYVVFLRPAH